MIAKKVKIMVGGLYYNIGQTRKNPVILTGEKFPDKSVNKLIRGRLKTLGILGCSPMKLFHIDQIQFFLSVLFRWFSHCFLETFKVKYIKKKEELFKHEAIPI